MNTVTLRVRRYRKRRRENLRLFTVELPEPVIEDAIARGLLKREDHTRPWPTIQSCYAALLSDAAPVGDTNYVADALLGALAAELVIYQRRVLGMPLKRQKDGWVELLDRLLGKS